MPCAVCTCEASSTFSHVLESKEGIKLKKGRPFWFIYRNLLNPDLYYIKSQFERKKANLMGPTKKRWNTHIFYILDFAGILPLSKSVKFTEKSYHLAPIPFVLWFLILLCLSNSLLRFYPLAQKYLKWIVHWMTTRRRHKEKNLRRKIRLYLVSVLENIYINLLE